ncbi:MAG: hypothetical protein KGQ77_13325, partial [Betaproteobacteria bacterium]|nr:hypothetical protein [Betaproteobacteria bacterium]
NPTASVSRPRSDALPEAVPKYLTSVGRNDLRRDERERRREIRPGLLSITAGRVEDKRRCRCA